MTVLTALNCTPKNGENDRHYVDFTTIKKAIKETYLVYREVRMAEMS